MLRGLSILLTGALIATGCGRKAKGFDTPNENTTALVGVSARSFPQTSFDQFMDTVQKCRGDSGFLSAYRANLTSVFPKLVNLRNKSGKIQADATGLTANFQISEAGEWTIDRPRATGPKRRAVDTFQTRAPDGFEGLISDTGYYLFLPDDYVHFVAKERMIVEEYKDARNWRATYEMSEFVDKGEHGPATEKSAHVLCKSVDGAVSVDSQKVK